MNNKRQWQERCMKDCLWVLNILPFFIKKQFFWFDEEKDEFWATHYIYKKIWFKSTYITYLENE